MQKRPDEESQLIVSIKRGTQGGMVSRWEPYFFFGPPYRQVAKIVGVASLYEKSPNEPLIIRQIIMRKTYRFVASTGV